MDRIDIHMQVPQVEYQKLRDMRPGESSAEVCERVEAARNGRYSTLREGYREQRGYASGAGV